MKYLLTTTFMLFGVYNAAFTSPVYLEADETYNNINLLYYNEEVLAIPTRTNATPAIQLQELQALKAGLDAFYKQDFEKAEENFSKALIIDASPLAYIYLSVLIEEEEKAGLYLKAANTLFLQGVVERAQFLKHYFLLEEFSAP